MRGQDPLATVGGAAALQLKPAVISVVQLGTLSYAEGLRLQQKLVEARKAGQIGNVKMVVTLITPIAMEQGLRFAIREGGKTVGAGVVADIIK